MPIPINVYRVKENIKNAMQQNYPVVKTDAFKVNGQTIFTLENIDAIIRAYIPTAIEKNGRYERFDDRERTTCWATDYYRKIAEKIPSFREKMNVSGVGYKYRDLIWITLAVLKALAREMDGANYRFPNEYKIWDVASYAQSTSEIQLVDLTPEQYAEINRRNQAARDEAMERNERAIQNEELNRVQQDNTWLYVAGGAALLALMLL